MSNPPIFTQLSSIEQTTLLAADAAIHRFLFDREYDPIVYSSTPQHFEYLEGDYFFRPADYEHRYHGEHVVAHSFHYPETVELVLQDSDVPSAHDVFDDDGIPSFCLFPVPLYHQTGEHIDQLAYKLRERGTPGRYSIYFQFPHVELSLCIDDRIFCQNLTATTPCRPSHLMNSAFVLAAAEFINSL